MNNDRCYKHRLRRRRGTSAAELPAILGLLFIGLLMPTVALSTLGYRAVLFYFAVRDCCHSAAITTPFSAAQTAASNRLVSDCAKFSGVTSPSVVTTCVQRNLATGSLENTVTAPIIPSKNIYLVRVVAIATIAPLIAVPGISEPFPLTIPYEMIAENPNGLLN